MPSHSERYRLSFLLPSGAVAPCGFHRPSLEGCSLQVSFGRVAIEGPSRQAVFDHAARFLRRAVAAGPQSISAVLATPAQPAGRDGWSIIVGADVAFSPTSLDPDFPSAARAQPPPRRRAG